MQAKKGGNVELKRIIIHNLGDSVRYIAEWMKLPMGPRKDITFSSATKNYLPPKTCVAPCVDHGVACT
jgi:hypothetical protein